MNEIEKKINRLKKIQPLLDFESYYRDLNNIEFSWEEWKLSLKENIKAIKEVNLKEKTTIREKEIKKAILKRCKDLEFNQKRMINSLTNLKKEMITLDRILIKDQNDPHISIEPKEILAETRKHYENALKQESPILTCLVKAGKKNINQVYVSRKNGLGNLWNQ